MLGINFKITRQNGVVLLVDERDKSITSICEPEDLALLKQKVIEAIKFYENKNDKNQDD
jgi:hypothetical protein